MSLRQYFVQKQILGQWSRREKYQFENSLQELAKHDNLHV